MKVKWYTDNLNRLDVQDYGREEFWISVEEMKKYGIKKVVIELEENEKVSCVSDRMAS